MELIIPDIHDNLVQLDRIIAKYNFIKNITAVGDWFDSFAYTSIDAAGDTARRLKDFISNPRQVSCLGNHDLPYFYPNITGLNCSGWAEWKQNQINKHMGPPEWNKLVLLRTFNFLGKAWVISHAGFHPYLAHPFNGMSVDWLYEMANKALEMARYGQMHYLLAAGKSRGGKRDFGGCTWLDFREFEPTEGLNQIVGHTFNQHGEARLRPGPKGEQNWCIDTGLKTVAILDDDGRCYIEAV